MNTVDDYALLLFLLRDFKVSKLYYFLIFP